MQGSFWKEWMEPFKGTGEDAVKRRANLILLCGLLGMAAIFFSQIHPKPDIPPKAEAAASQNTESDLERRLAGIVQEIAGVGRSKVMVTFKSGVEYVYAKDEKRTIDRLEGSHPSSGNSLQQKDNTETNYILVDGGGGKKQALVEKQLEPVVKGVVVLCEGADDPVVERRVTEAVSTALGISTSHICVIKISN